jgi:hypothetical protein
MEISCFFQSLQPPVEAAPEKEYRMVCTNSLDTFITKSILVRKEENNYSATVAYRVRRCDEDTVLSHELPGEYEHFHEVLEAFFSFLWDSTLCPECFSIMPLASSLCTECYPMRIMYQYGVIHNKTTCIPTCSICFEHVYHSKLRCGHYAHKTCFVLMNPNRWYSYDDEYKCPICRAPINDQDRREYFLSMI